jgi:hypothetical protein
MPRKSKNPPAKKTTGRVATTTAAAKRRKKNGASMDKNQSVAKVKKEEIHVINGVEVKTRIVENKTSNAIDGKDQRAAGWLLSTLPPPHACRRTPIVIPFQRMLTELFPMQPNIKIMQEYCMYGVYNGDK